MGSFVVVRSSSYLCDFLWLGIALWDDLWGLCVVLEFRFFIFVFWGYFGMVLCLSGLFISILCFRMVGIGRVMWVSLVMLVCNVLLA